MKKGRILCGILAAACAFSMSGCFDMPPEDFIDETADTEDVTSSNPAGGADSEPVKLSGLSGTRISLENDSLKITRRTRTESAPMGESGWTIMVYLCGTDLESAYGAATSDLYEALSAQYSDDVTLIFQSGGTDGWQCGISSDTLGRYVMTDGDIELVEELPAASMGSADTLASFVSWGVQNYPAANMGLVFWNHGGGSISGVCFDELNDSDSLSLREIDQALNSVYDRMTDKFEFIGFDACLMSTLETANILVPYANYMFASEETEPGGGWDYTSLFNFLAENPDATGAELGAMQCDSYYQHCIDNGDSLGTTFAITDLSKVDALVTAFNDAAKELYESGSINGIARAINSVDNFGGNTRSEGYTNMVDLGGILSAVSSYAPSAGRALNALDEAVVSIVNGTLHADARGLSVYFPLSVQGTEELSILADICPSTYYLALVDAIAYGTTGGDVLNYTNDSISFDSEDIWDTDYTAYDNIGTNSDGFDSAENCGMGVTSVYFDEDGVYTVTLEDMDIFCFAACSVFLVSDEGSYVYLGEDDDVIVDYDAKMLQDNFDGSWLTLDGTILPIEVVSVTDKVSVYTCPITLNGKPTNLRVEYDWATSEWSIAGVWAGIDSETGMASRDTAELKTGDVIAPVYTFVYPDGTTEDVAELEINYTEGMVPEYGALAASDYSYSMTLYDVYGNRYFTEYVTFTVDEDGSIYFYEDELDLEAYG